MKQLKQFKKSSWDSFDKPPIIDRTILTVLGTAILNNPVLATNVTLVVLEAVKIYQKLLKPLKTIARILICSWSSLNNFRNNPVFFRNIEQF